LRERLDGRSRSLFKASVLGVEPLSIGAFLDPAEPDVLAMGRRHACANVQSAPVAESPRLADFVEKGGA
jgi:hypothetical protein